LLFKQAVLVAAKAKFYIKHINIYDLSMKINPYQYLESLNVDRCVLVLKSMTELLVRLGNPQKSYSIIIAAPTAKIHRALTLHIAKAVTRWGSTRLLHSGGCPGRNSRNGRKYPAAILTGR
jgi:hypothetical protein